MPPLNELLPVLLLISVFFLTGRMLLRATSEPVESARSRYSELDGLRALLAFGVMMHHFFMIRYLVDKNLLISGQNCKLFNIFGTWTVQTFFAITAYLFTSQIVDNRQTKGYFLRFYIKRILRLGPLNLGVGLILAAFVAAIGGKDRSRFVTVFIDTILFNNPREDLSNIATLKWFGQIAAGPLWSIHAEWLFYLCAPLLAIRWIRRDRIIWLVGACITLFAFSDFPDFLTNWHAGHPYMTWAFLPGILLGFTRSYWQNISILRGPIGAMVGVE